MNNDEITEEFLDTYEGEVLFLSQDLEEIVDSIKDDSFNQDTLLVLQQKLNEVSDVFLSSTYTQHVAPLFKKIAEDIGSINIEMFKTLDDSKEYLCEIILDINTYINFYFVERIFSDVYLFQDSLKNSIDFFKRSCECAMGECIEDDGSELDFF